MNSNNWYHSHSFNFRGLTWEFTYIEATASRTIEATKPDGTKIYLKIPIKETTKFAYPLAWLEKWEQSKGKRILLREKAESRTLFEMELTPSKSPHDETEKTLLGVNGNKEASMEELTPSKLQQDETEKTLLGVNGNKEASMEELTPSKCLSCSLCQRISSILLTCLASPKYFTEETAKECERFTPIKQAQSEAEGFTLSEAEGNLEAIPKRPRRRRGSGSGTFITTYANHGKYGKKYPQISYQVEFGGKKRSIYVIAEKIEQIQELDRLGKPINEILEAIDSPKARKVLREYKDFMESKEEKI
ncbi:hypothetical protein H6G48_25160 [Microcystis flos-aquae FACHB-1344]|uniref:Uncharacterized protein n=1 Tax=Microcystis flos-aquae FACHB-1344 TaxID=2692899 RepID=A0ABR8I100_9CHRO|nr:hypothetical protein [Microcystis flos-aquae]MBD2624763.1 hypothetical protein [Microcystis flos-aquae FACHB-1344]